MGGISFVMDAVEKQHIASLIDKKLGKRAKQATFSYSDVLLGWIFANFCGADRLEDAKNLKNKCFSKIPGFKYSSPDSIALIFKSLATDSLECLNESKVKGEWSSINHKFNTNPKLNELMLDIAMKLDLLKTKTPYILDYDNTIIEHEKRDTTHTYKKKVRGYQPGACFIGKIPVYVEGRNGNSNATFKMDETLQRSLENLDRHGIKLKTFRSDAAAYQRSVIDIMESRDIEFFIRAKNSKVLKEEASFILNWEKKAIKYEKREFCEFDYKPRGFKKSYRVVMERKLSQHKEEKEEGKYIYYGIMTNNNEMSIEEVVHFYQQRGAIENNFEVLKYDFNWNHIPFSFLNENTVFLIISAIADIIYQYIIRKFSSQVSFVKKTFELKKFIQHVIALSTILYEDGTMEIEGSEHDYEALRDL